MKQVITGMLISMLMLFVSVGVVQAETQEERLVQIIEANTAELIATFEKKRSLYDEDPQAFFKTMDMALKKVVDFKRIAGRVIGKYLRETTSEQRLRFLESFKQSLFKAYGKALVESGSGIKVDVKNARIHPQNQSRALVDLEIVSQGGERYPVVYAMYKNDEGDWFLENVIVNGLNVGLVFRDRFEQLYRQESGNIDEVISAWSADIDPDASAG